MSLALSSTRQSSQEGPLSTGEVTGALSHGGFGLHFPFSWCGAVCDLPEVTTLQGLLYCSHTHYFLPDRAINTCVPTSWVETITGWLASSQPWVARVLWPHQVGGMGLGPYLQEQHWGSYPQQGESKTVTTISTALAGQRGGFSTLA
jgi:hypothetical protein